MILFQHLLDGINTANPTEQDFDNAEKFMCRAYNSLKDTLDEVRVTILLSTNKPEDNPPTSNAAKFHLCRSFCQAARWVNSGLLLHCDLPSTISCGGFTESDGLFMPIMITQEPRSEAMQEMVTCNCTGNYQVGQCGCKKKNLKCTVLCHKKLKYNHDKCLRMNREWS